MTTFRPLGDRVLIKPDGAPQQTASGLHLAEHWKPEQTGTVVAVGRTPHPRKAEIDAMAENLWNHEPSRNALAVGAAELLRELAYVEPVVKPGDYVIFSWMAGHEIWVNDGEDRYLLMRERDVLAVVGSDVTVEPCEPTREVSV